MVVSIYVDVIFTRFRCEKSFRDFLIGARKERVKASA